jgi:IS5 family transposase
MTRAREHVRLQVEDRSAEAKQVNVKIFYGGKGPARDAAYAELMEITTGVCDRAERVVARLRAVRGDRRVRRPAARLAEKIEHFVGLGRRVLDQTRRRVMEQEKVPSSEKVVSIFEPHTDVIVPSERKVVFGHKVCLTVGESALIIDAVVEDGAPADKTLAVRQVRRAKEILGKTPRQVVFDGAFASRDNLVEIKAEGPKDVVFSKAPGISARDMTASPRTHHLLKKFRAGIEGCISFLKRAVGLDRCTSRGEESFASYVWASVVGANLLTIARALLEAT